MKVVSIVIITYNAEQYVLDTLESAKNQTYQNIELIISDDGSKDNTVEICTDWISKNKSRFINARIVTVEKNTGVAANCNRGIANSTSEWIKFSAGDDLLLPNCIQDNMEFITKNTGVKVLFSQLYKFTGKFDSSMNHTKYPQEFPINLMDNSFTAEDQYKRLLLSDRITYTPSYFFNKRAINSVGAYDEKTQFIEDYPMWLKLTKAGIRLNFMEKVTVAYRQHEASLNAQFDEGLFSKQYLRTEAMRKVYVYPNLPWDISGKMKFKYQISKYFEKLGLNKKNEINKLLYRIFIDYLNPYQYIYSFKKHILKLKKNNILYSNEI